MSTDQPGEGPPAAIANALVQLRQAVSHDELRQAVSRGFATLDAALSHAGVLSSELLTAIESLDEPEGQLPEEGR